MNSGNIKKELQLFQYAVKSLSESIKGASLLWKDKKFSELSSNVTEIASNSRDVIVAGDRCCSSIDIFEKIANEKH